MIQLNMYMAETLFFLLLTFFLGIYLYGILGKESEEDERMRENFHDQLNSVTDESRTVKNDKESVCIISDDLVDYSYNDQIVNSLFDMQSKIPNFDLIDFASKSKQVFEVTFNAYVEFDKPTLKNLLSEEVYEIFSKNIDALKEKKNVMENLLFRIVSAKFYDVITSDETVSIVMRFISEQCNLIKDAKGNIIKGSEEYVAKHDELWTFEKLINSDNKIWYVSKIASKKND